MKRIISVVLFFVFLLGIMVPPVFAHDASIVSSTVVSASNSAKSFYEASVIARIAGRAGSTAPYGAKGVVFEQIYADMLNAKNLFSCLTTKLSVNSTDQLADLVTTNKNGEIVQLIQCKDGVSPSQIRDVCSRLSAGQYEGAELVGTTEFSELFNTKAASDGLEQRAVDSGISTETTSRIANTALGNRITGQELFGEVLKNAKIATGVSAVLALAESVIRGDNVYQATGNVITDTSITATSIVLGTMSRAGIQALLTTVGAGSIASTVVPSFVAFLVPVGCSYALYIVAEKTRVEESVAEIAEAIGASASDVTTRIESYLVEKGVYDKATCITTAVTSWANCNTANFLSWCGNIKASAVSKISEYLG